MMPGLSSELTRINRELRTKLKETDGKVRKLDIWLEGSKTRARYYHGKFQEAEKKLKLHSVDFELLSTLTIKLTETEGKLEKEVNQSCVWRKFGDKKIKEIELLEAKLAEAIKLIKFYGCPDTYHAIGFYPDEPCGAFMTDFGTNYDSEHYDRPMAGRRARRFLSSISKEE
jgi:hypothetical protein